MPRISSKLTYWNKRVFPVLWFGILGFFIVTQIVTGLPENQPLVLLGPVAIAAIGFVVMRKVVWNLVDEVYDGGEYLLIRNRGEEERLPLSNVMNVSASMLTNPRRITLRLVEPGKLGNEIAFSPAQRFSLNPFSKNPIAEDLIVRVDRARRRSDGR